MHAKGLNQRTQRPQLKYVLHLSLFYMLFLLKRMTCTTETSSMIKSNGFNMFWFMTLTFFNIQFLFSEMKCDTETWSTSWWLLHFETFYWIVSLIFRIFWFGCFFFIFVETGLMNCFCLAPKDWEQKKKWKKLSYHYFIW